MQRQASAVLLRIIGRWNSLRPVDNRRRIADRRGRRGTDVDRQQCRPDWRQHTRHWPLTTMTHQPLTIDHWRVWRPLTTLIILTTLTNRRRSMHAPTTAAAGIDFTTYRLVSSRTHRVPCIVLAVLSVPLESLQVPARSFVVVVRSSPAGRPEVELCFISRPHTHAHTHKVAAA